MFPKEEPAKMKGQSGAGEEWTRGDISLYESMMTAVPVMTGNLPNPPPFQNVFVLISKNMCALVNGHTPCVFSQLE